MKVLLINGSPRANGNTGTALAEIARILSENGLETETVHIGNQAIRGCIGCNQCRTGNGCVFADDCVNALAAKCAGADGFVFGSPVYYASANGTLISLMDRLFYSSGKALAHKPAAAIACARRAGTTATVDQLNKYFTINQMPVVSSTYWNVAHGAKPGESALDAEGMKTMRNLASNMVWLLRCIEAGKQGGIVPPQAEQGNFMNFIR